MRIGIDATPLLGRLTGVGTYTSNLLAALCATDRSDDFVATAFTLRGRGQLSSVVPPGVEVRSRPVPARMLRATWARTELLPVEVLTGPLDVFHATNFVLPPVRRSAGVVTVHDLSYLRFPETVATASGAYRELVPVGLDRASMVCTPSRAVADQLQDAYAVPEERIAVTPLGVDAEWFETTPPSPAWLANLGAPPSYLLAVGTLEPRKNLAALVEAYRRLALQTPETPPLVLAGGSGWGSSLDLSAIPAGRVLLTGHLAYADLRRLVAGASLLAFPSLDEGFGLPPLEALATGVAVLANDLPVTREVLGLAAGYCDASDPDALAQALHESVTAPVGTRQTRQAHAAGYTWDRCAQLTDTAYERAAG